MKDIDKELIVFVPVSADTPPILEDTTDAKAFNVLINGSVFSSGVLYKDGFWSYDTTLGKLTHWLKEVPANDYAKDKVKELQDDFKFNEIKNVLHGSAGIEKVTPFKYRGKQYYAEMHCFCGLMVSDKNRMGVFVDHPAHIYAAKMLDKKKEFKN